MIRLLLLSVSIFYLNSINTVAQARLNESLKQSREYAQSIGIIEGEYACDGFMGRVLFESWISQGNGWSFDEAKKLASLMMNSRKYNKLKKYQFVHTVDGIKINKNLILLCYGNGSKKDEVWLSLLDQVDGGKIWKIEGWSSEYSSNKKYFEFRYKIKDGFVYFNDKVLVKKSMYDRISMGMSRDKILSLMGGDSGVLISEAQLFEENQTTYKYENFDGSFMILTFDKENLISKHQFGLE